ncbi:MAG: hypothetical protein RIF46_12805 [Cyclobacteriaceae bacterium]
MIAIFPERFDKYKSEEDFKVRELNDGTVRISKTFLGGEKELKIKLSASSDENLDENLAAIGQLIVSLEEMANQGIMTIERDEGKFHSGMFTFISRQQNVAGALFLVRDRYMLEIELIGGESMEEAKQIFAQIDLTKLE